MPLAEILLTDTFFEWMTKDNAMIDQVNALSVTGDLLSITSPSSGQILVWNGSFFVNVTMNGDATINSSGTINVSGGSGATDGFIYFMGNIRGLF